METAQEARERRKKGFNLMERAIALVAPGTALRRSMAREQMRFFGLDGGPSGLRGKSGGASRNAAAETSLKSRERIGLMWDARHAEEHICLIAGVLENVAVYVCDDLSYQADTGDDVLDGEYEAYFHDWCGRCDLTGRHRFRELVELALRHTLRDGDVGALVLDDPYDEAADWPELRLQMVEADRIGKPEEARNVTRNYINGIHLDEFGRPVQYDVYDRDPQSGQYNIDVKAPADRFVHLFHPRRTDQYRGVSFLKPALPHARDIYELFGFEKVGAKFAAQWAAFIRQADPGAPGAFNFERMSGGGEATGKAKNIMQAEAGKIVKLGAGEDITMAPGVTRPSGAFLDLVQSLVREISVGLGLPYGFVYDLSVLGGVSSRIVVRQAHRRFRRWQRLLEDKFLNRVKSMVLARGIVRGDLRQHSRWDHGRWQWPASITTDIGHETQAAISEVQFGLATMGDIMAEAGRDPEETMVRRANEVLKAQRIAMEKRVPVELIMGMSAPMATQQLAAMQTPPAPPIPGLIGSVGESGVKPLLEVLTNVGEGKMDRKSGIDTLVALYGLTPEEADRITPRVTPLKEETTANKR